VERHRSEHSRLGARLVRAVTSQPRDASQRS
jgi:hypothetical protein